MKTQTLKEKLSILLMCGALMVIILSTSSLSLANDHKESKKHSQKYEHHNGDQGFTRIFGGGHDEGNETTGQIAAWSLGAVNLTIAISLLIRGMKRFVPLTPELKNSIIQFNHFQKRYLMRFHYYLNPVFVSIAILHWSLSKCESTALTEWSLFAMCLMATLGIALKFKLVPKTSLRNVHKLHTQPVIFLSLICLLVIGHLVMD